MSANFRDTGELAALRPAVAPSSHRAEPCRTRRCAVHPSRRACRVVRRGSQSDQPTDPGPVSPGRDTGDPPRRAVEEPARGLHEPHGVARQRLCADADNFTERAREPRLRPHTVRRLKGLRPSSLVRSPHSGPTPWAVPPPTDRRLRAALARATLTSCAGCFTTSARILRSSGSFLMCRAPIRHTLPPCGQSMSHTPRCTGSRETAPGGGLAPGRCRTLRIPRGLVHDR